VTNCFGKRSEGLGVDSVPVREEEAARKGYLAESTLEKRPANGAAGALHPPRPPGGGARPGRAVGGGEPPLRGRSDCGKPDCGASGKLRHTIRPDV